MTKTLSAVAVLLALAAPAFAQDVEKPPAGAGPTEDAAPAPQKASLAVMPFSYSREFLRRQKDGDLALAVDQFETTSLTNKFITALVNTRKFDVIERQRIDTALQEFEMADDGLMDPARAARAGHMIGADYLLMGEISVFSINITWRRIPHTSRLSRTVEALIIVDMRIVETETSRVVAADRGEVRDATRTMHAAQEPTRFEADYIDGLQRALCDQLVLKTIDGVYPVRIIGFAAGVASLNRGEGGGLSEGQLFDVFLEGQEMVDPDTGESLGFEEERVGTIRVIQILPRFSKAELVGELRAADLRGAVCRPRPDAEPEARPRPDRPRPRW